MNKITDLKNRQIIILNDKILYHSKYNKIRPFLVLKINKHYKEAICCKLSTKEPLHKPYIKFNRNIKNKQITSYIWIFQIFTIKYKNVICAYEQLNYDLYKQCIIKLIDYIK